MGQVCEKMCNFGQKLHFEKFNLVNVDKLKPQADSNQPDTLTT